MDTEGNTGTMESVYKTADLYIEDLFEDNDEALKAVARSVSALHIPDMSVSASQGRLLHVLAKLCNSKKILEIGTFLGYSTIWLARALPQNGRLISIENDQAFATFASQNIANAGLGEIVSIRTGKALEVLPQILAEDLNPFDMVFIDADKPNYAGYLEWALRLARPGTLIVADNVIRHVFDRDTPEEKRAGVMRFNELLSSCVGVSAAIIQQVGIKEHDGMAIAVVN